MKSSYQFKVMRIGEPLVAPKADQPEICFQYWRDVIAKADWFDPNKEHLVVLCLNTRYTITGYNLVSMGSVNESIAHPREILRPVIVAGAYAFILMHNHPSGDPSPSLCDHSMTRKIREGADLLNVKLLDHIIVGETYHSFKEAGVL